MSEDIEITKAVAKICFKWIGLVAMALILSMVLFHFCHGKETPVSNNDPLHDTQVVLNHEINKNVTSVNQILVRKKQDSIDMAKAYEKLKLRYLKAIRQAPDTCRSYIDTVYGDALIIDLTDSIAIARQDTIIRLLSDQVKLYQKVTRNDTLRINQLTDSIPKVAKSEFKRGKRVGRKQGVVGGLILSGAVIFGVKSVIP